MNQITPLFHRAPSLASFAPGIPSQRAPVLLVVGHGPLLAGELDRICRFLEIDVEHLMPGTDLAGELRTLNPMGVIADLQGTELDGFHVMKVVASFDASLPMLVLTAGDSKLLGAAEAVEQVWGLTSVQKSPFLPPVGRVIEFLCHAGRAGNCLNLMPV